MISVLHESRGGVFSDNGSPFFNHSFPSRNPFNIHTSLKKHLSPSTLPPFITSYIGETGLRPSSRSFSQPLNEYHSVSPFAHLSTKDANKSILKKPTQESFPTRFPYSTNHLERPCSVPCASKKVDFKHDVLVIHFDKNEGDHVRSESLSLTLEPKNKKKMPRSSTKKRDMRLDYSLDRSKDDRFVKLQGTTSSQLKYGENGTMKSSSYTDDDLPSLKSRPYHSSIVVSSNPTHSFSHIEVPKPKVIFRSVRSSMQPTHKSTNQVYSNTIPIGNEAALNSKSLLLSPKNNINEENLEYLQNIEFKLFEDDFNKLWLRFVVDLGPGVSANDVLVKANLTGNKVRIVGFRLKNRGSIREDFNKRCLLPFEVDPYMVSARMDSDGRLFVEGLVTKKNNVQ